MEKGIKIVLTEKEMKRTLQGLRQQKTILEHLIENGCEENRQILREELEEVGGIIKKLEGD